MEVAKKYGGDDVPLLDGYLGRWWGGGGLRIATERRHKEGREDGERIFFREFGFQK